MLLAVSALAAVVSPQTPPPPPPLQPHLVFIGFVVHMFSDRCTLNRHGVCARVCCADRVL